MRVGRVVGEEEAGVVGGCDGDEQSAGEAGAVGASSQRCSAVEAGGTTKRDAASATAVKVLAGRKRFKGRERRGCSS